jgi:hypothetical protein
MFCDESLERVKLHVFCMNFMMGFVEATLWDKHNKKDFAGKLLLAHPFQGRS